MAAVLKLVLRTAATLAIEAIAFYALAQILGGVRIAGWRSGVALVLVIGVANAALRPLLLYLALNLALGWFALIALSLNLAVLYIADAVVPGVGIHGLSTWIGLAVGLAIVNAIVTGLMSISDADAYYRNVTRRIARRHAPPQELERPGTVIIQIDGLAEPILRQELAAGRLPTIGRLLADSTHRLVRWDCGVPSMTPASQAGILHGNSRNVPAFRWYEKERKRLLVANHPQDARLLDARLRTGHGLLREGGASNANIFGGEADHLVLTQAGLVDERGRLHVSPGDFYAYMFNPYNICRTLVGMTGEVLLEYWQAWRQRRRRGEPRVARGGIYPLVRAACTVLLQNITEYLVIDDMYRGRAVSYSDFVGYDEVAHHSGPRSPDALGELRRIDRALGKIVAATQKAPRPYRFVLLSDHGQSAGWTFRHVHGYTLAELIGRLTAGDVPTTMAAGRGEGDAHLSAALNQIASAAGLVGRGLRRVLGGTGAPIHLGPAGSSRELDIQGHTVVCASGNLALVYFTARSGRLTLEEVEHWYPGVIAALRGHASIGFLLVRSREHGSTVLGPAGERRLEDGRVVGDDPLAGFEASTAASLRRLSSFDNVGDIVVNSTFDGGQTVGFEELAGIHGGAGGMQTQPFLLIPADWADENLHIFGPEAVHTFLQRHLAGVVAERPAAADVATHAPQANPERA